MSPDLTIALFTVPGALSAVVSAVWLYFALACRPSLGLADFGSKDNNSATINTTYQDAFNKSFSSVKSLADSGNVNFSLGGGASADVITNLVPLLAFVFAALGGLWLVTRD